MIKIKSKEEKRLLDNFFVYGDEDVRDKLSNGGRHRTFISRCLIPYWKQGRGMKKRVAFVRKFWENPDSNDADTTAAFKKRNDHNRM